MADFDLKKALKEKDRSSIESYIQSIKKPEPGDYKNFLWLIVEKETKLADKMLEKGVRLDKPYNKHVILNVVARAGFSFGLRYCLDRGSPPNLLDGEKRNALHWILSSALVPEFMVAENYKSIRLLIDAGVQLNQRDICKCTPLDYACQELTPKLRVVSLLLQSGAELKYCREKGLSPLWEAMRATDPRLVKLLLKQGFYKPKDLKVKPNGQFLSALESLNVHERPEHLKHLQRFEKNYKK